MANGDFTVYGNLPLHLWNARIDFPNDTIKVALVTGYTFSQAHDYWDDVSASEVSGTNYTAGGVTLASKTTTFTAANSWGTQWAATTAYTVGQIVRPTAGNGFLYRVITAGTSGGSEPTWSTNLGATVADNTVTWEVWSRGIIQIDAADPSWTNLDAGTPSHAIFYKSTGTGSTSPLIGAMEATTPSNGGNYSITLPTLGIIVAATY